MTMLLRDVIDIPERAGAEDYVLRLTDSVGDDHISRTLDEYVVTPALADSFDKALGLVADAVVNNTSRGAFLMGSFGSGKSHFMAVLHALLRQVPQARALPDLGPVIAANDPVLQPRKILPLAFHFLAAESMEQALFTGYLEQIRELHPGCVLPALHQSDTLLVDADNMRDRLGDDAFFAGLNPASGTDVWDDFLGADAWNADSYAAARAAAPGSSERQELVTALVEAYFKSYIQQATWVSLDAGLSAISRHAKALGYDAVVLFLDEVVLWLAFAVRDTSWFARESQKLSKLVEGGQGSRPIPLVSFVARQLDLRRWFADAGASGAQQEALDQAFRHQEGRFSQIRLGDDNLAFVANRRLLRPRDEGAARVLDSAFAQLERRPAVWDVLLDGVNTDESHRGADEAAFRLTYPFSPALVSTLRSLASVMQRERTALKVMQQMLVDRREFLTVDDVIPVGDAFDYIVTGQAGQALDAQIAALFSAAEKLYFEKLRPILLNTYGLTEAGLAAGGAVPDGFRADERLAKTLLLSAVAPHVPALKGLTAGRLASLNHGSIVSMLPGGEVTSVAAKVRTWAKSVPEIRLGDDSRDPLIRVVLSDVEYETVVDRARGEDNEGRRRELIKQLVIDGLGIELDAPDAFGAQRHRMTWRGSGREVDVVFGNVRDAGWLTDDHFRNRPESWRVVIDVPFDDQGHSSAEDVDRVDRLLASNFTARTLVWLPRFFSAERMRDVRRLVILNWLLDGSGERFAGYSDHLSESDRGIARAILESQRTSLRHELGRAIDVAYDAAAPTRSDDVVTDAQHDRVLTSLERSFTPQPPVSATLGGAFRTLLAQAWEAVYPGHPHFEPADKEVTRRELAAVMSHVNRALASPDGRVELEGDIAAARRIANPLGVGWAAETHFLMGDDRFSQWGPAFERALGARDAGPSAPVKVAEARGWIEALTPKKGLKSDVADLVILAWGALRRRAWFLRDAAIPAPAPGALTAEMELREQPMPTVEEWGAATGLAGALFGTTADAYLTPPGVAAFAEAVKQAAASRTQPAYKLVTALERTNGRLGWEGREATGRLTTARATAELCDRLRQLGGVDLIRALASAQVPNRTVAARSLAKADQVADALDRFEWDRLEPLREASQGEGPAADQASFIVARLEAALVADEFDTPIASELSHAERESYEWMRGQVAPQPKPEPRRSAQATPSATGRRRLGPGDSLDTVLDEVRRFRSQNPGVVVVEWRVE